MTACYDAFQDLQKTTPEGDHSPEEALSNARRLVSAVQHRALNSLEDGFIRQLGAILFSHLLKSLEKPLPLNEPKVWESVDGSQHKKPASALLGLGAAFFLILILTLYHDGQVLLFILGLSTAVILGVAWAINLRKSGKKQQFATFSVNEAALMCIIGEHLRMIDRNLETIEALVPSGQSGEISDSVLDTMMKLYEIAARMEQINPELNQAITHYLSANGISQVEYSLLNASVFQTLPTLASTRTIIPALMREGHLLRMGLAVVQKEGEN